MEEAILEHLAKVRGWATAKEVAKAIGTNYFYTSRTLKSLYNKERLARILCAGKRGRQVLYRYLE